MKAGAHAIVIQVCAALLCAGASAEVVVPHNEQPALIGAPNPMLAGIERVHLVIEAPDAEPNKGGLMWRDLEAKLEQKLSDAGLMPRHPTRAQPGATPTLRIDVDILELPDSKQYVFHAQTCLAEKMQLRSDSPHFVQADIWKVPPAMEAVPVEQMPQTVTTAVLEQVDAFIHCHSVANPQRDGPPDANVAAAPRKTIPTTPQPDPFRYKYVGSRRSNVFHKSDCRWVQRIAPNNLVRYNSRDEALLRGKRPCKRCNP